MSTSDLAVITSAISSLASTGALVYTVRRVSPWPKQPVQPQPRTPQPAPETAAGGAP